MNTSRVGPRSCFVDGVVFLHNGDIWRVELAVLTWALLQEEAAINCQNNIHQRATLFDLFVVVYNGSKFVIYDCSGD